MSENSVWIKVSYETVTDGIIPDGGSMGVRLKLPENGLELRVMLREQAKLLADRLAETIKK